MGGENYGQGSSREHAALGPMHLGVRTVLVKSFARIHKANLINYGIIPVTFKHSADYDKIAENDKIELTGLKTLKLIKSNGECVPLECIIDLDERGANILLSGGLANYTRNN